MTCPVYFGKSTFKNGVVMRTYLRRQVGLLLLAGALFTGMGSAQEMGSLRVMAPASPGGGWDTTSRYIQSVLQETDIVPRVEVFNVEGAGGTIGLAQLASAERGQGDLLMMMGLVMTGAVLTNDSAVTLAETTPIASLTAEYEVIAVPTSSPFQTLDDLLNALREDPGAVSWGGGSAGGTDHILAGLVAQAAGVDPSQLNYIPYSGGGEALAAVLGSQVSAGVTGYGEWAGSIESGDLRALALSSPERLEGIDVATLTEQGIDVTLANWRGVVAPPDLSDEQTSALLAVVDKLHASPEWQAILKENNWDDVYRSGDEFAAYLESEDARVQDILVDIGLVGE